jgi:hypothetical protein
MPKIRQSQSDVAEDKLVVKKKFGILSEATKDYILITEKD